MKETGEATKKTTNKRKRAIWLIILGLALSLLVIGGIEAYRILYKPQDLFSASTMDPSLLANQNATPLPTPEPEDAVSASHSEAATATPSIEPTTAPTPTPGITETKEILNILLIGVDRRHEANGSTGKGTDASEGTDPHADVQMIVAINFKEKKVDLISLPRDTFIHNPELMNGVYKINATFNVGGGFANEKEGFQKVCEGAEYMLGGIPVDYYYAVDFESLVKMVDAIGGVDYDVESASYSRKHKKGKQHMNGADVLFYVRVRKAGPEQGDLHRINRQKEMMIAIFSQLKAKGKLSMVPDLISAANSGIYTNINLEQTLALVSFAKSLDIKKIGMHSMVGPSADALGWRWCFTDQPKRIALIKKVYGIDVPEQVHYSKRYADWLRSNGFKAIVYMKTARAVLDYADARKANLTDAQQKTHSTLASLCTKTKSAFDLASLTFSSTNNRSLAYECKKLREYTEKLAKELGYKEELKWTYNTVANNWVNEPKINEVRVDFN